MGQGQLVFDKTCPHCGEYYQFTNWQRRLRGRTTVHELACMKRTPEERIKANKRNALKRHA